MLRFVDCLISTWTYFRRVEVDSDNVEGPWASRGPKKNPGDQISPMLVDSEVYKSFLVHALQELKLEPFAWVSKLLLSINQKIGLWASWKYPMTSHVRETKDKSNEIVEFIQVRLLDAE